MIYEGCYGCLDFLEVLWLGDLYEQKLTTEYTIKPHKHIDKAGTRQQLEG